MEDVDKPNNIQDCFIHYQLLRFCQATRLQYLNGQVQLANQQVLQQQHVDHQIVSALLKGTRHDYKKWNLQDSDWVDMCLHESHNKGGFNVPNNTISRHAAAYTTNTRFVAFLGTFQPCPGSLDARQRPPGSSHLESPPPLFAQAPARSNQSP
jgi:hypothetical protein